jgi:hypothetical protein
MADARHHPDLPRLVRCILARQGRREGREIRFLCPAHDDQRPSARWNPDKSTWYCDACHQGGGWRDLAERLGLPAPQPAREIAAVYPYRDAAGRLLYEVLRFVPKAFACRRPDPAGWRWNLQGVQRVLYRLPELLAAVAGGAEIFLTEGEKDADALTALGLPATTHAGGAGKWRPEYNHPLRHARVVLLPDNDDPGHRHMAEVEQSLRPLAATVCRLDLPGLPAKGDVSDWIAARRAESLGDEAIRAQLLALAQAALAATREPGTPQPFDPLAQQQPPMPEPSGPHAPGAAPPAAARELRTPARSALLAPHAPRLAAEPPAGPAPRSAGSHHRAGSGHLPSASPHLSSGTPEDSEPLALDAPPPSAAPPTGPDTPRSAGSPHHRAGSGHLPSASPHPSSGTPDSEPLAPDAPPPTAAPLTGPDAPRSAGSPHQLAGGGRLPSDPSSGPPHPPSGTTSLPALPAPLPAPPAPPPAPSGAPRPAVPGVRRLSEVVARPIHYLWEPYLPLGKLTLMDGDPGQGKSWLTAAVAAAGSRGRGLPGAPPFEPFTTLFFTEDPAEDVLRPRLDLLGADCSRILTCDSFELPLDLSQPADVARTEQLVADHRARLLVVDPIQAFLGARTDIYRPNEVRAVLAPLLRLAQRHACALLVLRHITKARASRSIYAGQGSIDFIAAARSVLLAGSGPEDPHRHALVHIKSNLTAPGPTLGYRFDGRCFAWEGTSTLSANDLLAADNQDDQGAEQEARLFLRDILAGSESLPARAVLAAAHEAGIAHRTLKRAKRREGIRTIRQGFGAGAIWLWALPAAPTGPPAAEGGHPQTWPPMGEAGPLRPQPLPDEPPPAPPPDEKVTV